MALYANSKVCCDRVGFSMLKKIFGICVVFICLQAHAKEGKAERPLLENTASALPSDKITPAQKFELENKKYQALEAFAKALNILESQYVDPASVNPNALMEKALKGIATDLDPHTVYLSPKQYLEFSSDTSGKFGGIGIIVNPANGRLEVVEVIEGSPAQKNGLKVGDIITNIDGFAINAKSMEEALSKMRGPVGSVIKITCTSSDPAGKGPRTKDLVLHREVIRTKSVTMHELSDGFAYAKLSIFQEDASESLGKNLRDFEQKNHGKIQGLILDLRNNPGGLLEQAVKVTNLFIDSGIIVSTIGRDKNKPEDVEYAVKRNTLPYFPMIVLVNEGTASASEIVAGALQDRERAIIMGTQTFGKGSVQSIVPLPNGGALKLTIARYYTPNGRSIQAKGITPDIPLLSQSTINKINTDVHDPKTRREVDLDKHIVSQDEDSAALMKKKENDKDMIQWPKALKEDYQVKSAYAYLKSIGRYAMILENKP